MAALSAGDFVGDRQAKSSSPLSAAILFPGPIALGTIKSFEEMRQLFVSDARSSIGYGDMDIVPLARRLDRNLPLFGRIFNSVVKQVQEKAQQQVEIAEKNEILGDFF